MKSAVEQFRLAMKCAEHSPYRDVLRRDPCVYCSAWPVPHLGVSNKMTLEHIVPRVDGGSNDWRNLAAAHESCNGHRSHSPLLIYLLYRRELGRLQGPQHRKARKRLRRSTGAMRWPVRADGPPRHDAKRDARSTGEDVADGLR